MKVVTRPYLYFNHLSRFDLVVQTLVLITRLEANEKQINLAT